MTERNPVVWGGLYRVRHGRWDNDQSYGLAVPVRDKEGHAHMVDTHLIHSHGIGTADAIEYVLGADDPKRGEGILYGAYDYYHRNFERVDEADLGSDYELLGDLHGFRPLERTESADEYLPTDVLNYVELYQDHGYPHGVSLVRRDAQKDPDAEVMHAIREVTPVAPDPKAWDAKGLCRHVRGMLDGDDLSFDTVLSLVERLRQVRYAEQLQEKWKAMRDNQKESRDGYARLRTRTVFDELKGDFVALGDIDGMADYLENDCYCPNEIYDAGGFYYELFPPTSSARVLERSNDGDARFLVAALNKDETSLQLIAFTRDDDGRVADAVRADLTDRNRDVMRRFVETGAWVEAPVEKRVETEPATEELLALARQLVDLVDPQEGRK